MAAKVALALRGSPQLSSCRTLCRTAHMCSWHGNGFPTGAIRERPRQEPQCLEDPALEVIHHHFHSVLLVALLSPREGTR